MRVSFSVGVVVAVVALVNLALPHAAGAGLPLGVNPVVCLELGACGGGGGRG